MLILNADEVRKALSMREAIEAMKGAYAALSSETAAVPLRSRLRIESGRAEVLFMPAYVPGEPEASLAVKVVSLFPHNPESDLPFIHAAVLVMDAGSGEMLALVEGATLTAIRTGAGAGAATDLLARPDCTTAALLGSGPQAVTQLLALCAVRELEVVRIFSRLPAHVLALIERMQPQVAARLLAAASPAEAVRGADIVTAATNSSSPVFADADIAPGTHINGIGSYTPDMVEIPPETVGRGSVFVDSRAACAAEAGELLLAVEKGYASAEDFVEIGAVAGGEHPGRSTPEEITVFKSVGVAVQDAAAAQLALSRAQELGLGTHVDW